MVDNKRCSKYESPLRYPGGKSCLFPFISKLLYENNLIGTNYAEPYAGGSGLALKLLFNEYVNNIYINDYDYSIYCFWKTVLNSNDRLCDWIESVDVSLDNWWYFKNIQKKLRDYSEFEIAQSTFFLNRTNISGIIKGGLIGGLKQNGKYKIDARFNKTDLIARINRIGLFKNRISVTNLDGLKFINKLNKLSDNMFVYLDPPYVQKGAELYMNYFKKQDHSNLANKINLIKHRWLVSYDNNEFILSLYNKHRKVIYRLSHSASNRVGDEILIFSDVINYYSSIMKLEHPLEI